MEALRGPSWKQAACARVHVKEPITTIEGQTGPVKGVALSPAGGFAASMSAGDAGKLIVWKPASLNSW